MVVRLSRRGTITLPKDVRGRLEEGTPFEVVQREDGVIELRPHAARDPSQAWFWTEKWQQMEREADEEIAAGLDSPTMTGEEFLAYLDKLAADSRKERGGDGSGTEGE